MQRNEVDSTPSLGNTSQERTIQAAQEHNLLLRVSTFPNDSHSWFLLGCLRRRRGNLLEAEKALRKAVTLNPAPTVFWSELASVLHDLGHERVDPEILRRISSEKPDSLHPPEKLVKQIRKTRINDDLRNAEAVPRIIAHASSPCISCPDYTYYGCRRQEACTKLIQWRTQAK